MPCFCCCRVGAAGAKRRWRLAPSIVFGSGYSVLRLLSEGTDGGFFQAPAGIDVDLGGVSLGLLRALALALLQPLTRLSFCGTPLYL